jgi:predicted transcriptional regulator
VFLYPPYVIPYREPSAQLSIAFGSAVRRWRSIPMKNTSIYLDEADVDRLRRLAHREGRSQAEIVRAALAANESQCVPDRNFALAASWEGDGTSIAHIPEEELLKGFGL